MAATSSRSGSPGARSGTSRNDWLICLVDNHRTRLEALEVCDEHGCQAIFAANETHSSEAYYYRRQWQGTPRDPRVYYPELNTDRSGDPRAASIGCTGEAQANNRQLVSANFMAAALAEHLFVLWHFKAPRMDQETVALLPHKFAANLSKLETCERRTNMNGATTLPNPVIPGERKCRIEEVFDQNFIELLGLVPRNPFVRALILKLTKKMPGPECRDV